MSPYLIIVLAIIILPTVSYFIIRDEKHTYNGKDDIPEDPTEDFWDNDEPHTEHQFH